MEVIITEWGLQSYLNLKAKGVFTDDDYKKILRPDAELLKRYPNDPKFNNNKFWGPATLKGKNIKHGYKMKWHNLGPGHNQLRLCVAILKTELNGENKRRVLICKSYIKDEKKEKIAMLNFNAHIMKIIDGTYVYRGKL